MNKINTKQRLIDSGISLMKEKGYHNTGLMEIVKAAGVPKGSFYHFFASKEAFGLAVLDYYSDEFEPYMVAILTDPSVPPLQRLHNFFEGGREQLLGDSCRGGCFIGNLAQELSDQDEVFRASLAVVLQRWEQHFANCLRDAIAQGELPKDLDADMMGRFIINSWEGAILRMKVLKSIEPVEGFIEMLFTVILPRSQSISE